ncbi:phosphatase PAP2 family protein [Mycolicibacterium sp. CH28]|uniref:phosphatase PAP2 family protein n=1 Tax=Mycolicibacterium sp. CH28 TaxID=2512237 RepID=UPI001386D16D|nr:phosphatase PAP2 family protein [Mycolicibacterium sp. CH28]
MTALTVSAVVLIAAALVRRDRLALILLAAGLLSVLAVMAVQINSGWMTALDTSVWNWFDAHREHRGQGDSMGIFAYIGRPVHVAIAGVVTGTLLALRARSVMRAVVVIGTVGAGAAAEQILKHLVERTPANLAQLRDGSVVDWSQVDYYANSFPSGHVTGSATLLGTIAVCLGIGRSRAIKMAATGLATTGVAFVAILALYVRAHIFTDVVGGMVLGAALVALGVAVLMPARRPTKHRIRPAKARYSVIPDLIERTRS